MGIFKKKKIVRAEIVGQSGGTSEEEQLMNYAAGHMMGGFDGMVHADLLYEEPTTTFKLFYSDGSTGFVTVKTGSFQYNQYLAYVE